MTEGFDDNESYIIELSKEDIYNSLIPVMGPSKTGELLGFESVFSFGKALLTKSDYIPISDSAYVLISDLFPNIQISPYDKQKGKKVNYDSK